MKLLAKYSFKRNAIILIILSCAILFRFFNLSYDDLWIDEMSTFWVSNPKFSLIESYNNHKSFEQTPFTFNFLIKYYFKFFGYNESIARFIPAISSFFSIISLMYISKLLTKNYSYLLVIFLSSFNIFLIAYSQELRVYSTFFLFNCISILFFFRYLFFNKKTDLSFFIFSSIILISLHPFSFILISSFFCFVSNLYLYKKEKTKIIIILLTLIIYFFIFYFYETKENLSSPSWITQPDIKFITNLYFSKFFGSRLIGLIHLLVLIFLVVQFIKKKEFHSYISFFIIFLFLAYIIPIFYGILFKPIILPRYIIFVLIPIFILLSSLIFEQKKNIKISLIVLFISITLGNFITEDTFKQFFNKRNVYKPEVNKMLSLISSSPTNSIQVHLLLDQKEITKAAEKSYYNYFDYLSHKYDFTINKHEDKKLNNFYWLVCFIDTDINKCNFPKRKEVIKKVNFNRLKIFLINNEKD